MLSKEYLLKIILGNYTQISDFVRIYSKEEIIQVVCEILEMDQDELKNFVVRGYNRAGDRASYEYAISDFIQNIGYYDQVYQCLEDAVSKEVFSYLVRYRLIPDEQFFKNAGIISRDSNVESLSHSTESINLIHAEPPVSVVSGILKEKENMETSSSNYAVCVHNVISDFWVSPMVIREIKKDVSYDIRHYEGENAGKTMYYVIPKKRKEKEPVQIKRVVAMAPYERPWSNVELVKDCGLIPYLLYKNHGCDVSMVGAKGGEYPYAELVEGMKLEFLEDGKEETKIQYIYENGKEIDCLILRGAYDSNFGVAKAYKTVNPEGRIYIGLDANSNWVDRVWWYRDEFMEFMNHCDYIATSCTAMEKHLNEKWPWKIHCIPNGYYDLFGKNINKVCFEEKENTILTVGRLGTIQKATEILLEAFALISEKIPDWTLKLVGTVENNFKEYIEGYFRKYPDLETRVIFTGSIEDRTKLYEEYEKAKIFGLPSRLEGGTPNVIAEALQAGCVLALTKFDAYEDAIGVDEDHKYGICGRAAAVDHVQAYADLLLQLCKSKDLPELSKEAIKRANEFYDMEKIVGGLYEQLCI